jgi:hypothetical protein
MDDVKNSLRKCRRLNSPQDCWYLRPTFIDGKGREWVPGKFRNRTTGLVRDEERPAAGQECSEKLASIAHPSMLS